MSEFGGNSVAVQQPRQFSIKESILMQTLGINQQDPFDKALATTLESKNAEQRVMVAERVAKLRADGVGEAEIAYIYTGRYVPSV